MAQEAGPVDLKKWMQKENVYDNDIYAILTEQGVAKDEDFKTYTQEQWDELWRRGAVERAKELKDQKAKVAMEKKMTKIEKYWRKCSGVKSTSVKKKGGKKEAPPLDNSAAAQQDALSQAPGLKKWLQKSECYSVDLLMVLVNIGITEEAHIEKIDSNSSFDDIYRQVRVLKAKDLKSNEARMRMEKQMTKFEKQWRAKTGIKKSSVQKGGSKGTKKKTPKDEKNEAMASGGSQLKNWMRKNDVWEMSLYDELMANNISNPEQLKDVTEDKFDEIVRKVRVDRFSQLKDQKARNRADKLLVKFEKEWRKASGVKKTSLKKK